MKCTAYTYHVTLMAKCTHPLKLLPSAMFSYVQIQISRDGFMLRFIWCSWTAI